MVRLGRRAAAVCAYHQAAEVPQCTTQPAGCHVCLGSRQSVPLLEVRGDVERIEPDPAASFFRRIANRYSGDEPPPDAPPRGETPAAARTGWSSWFARPGSASIKKANTAMTTPNIDLGRFGVFTMDPRSSFIDLGMAVVTPEQAQEIERLGYGTLWISGAPASKFVVCRAAFGVHQCAKGCHRHRQYPDGGRQDRRRFVPPHQCRPPRPIRARHRRPAIPSTPSNTASRTTRWSGLPRRARRIRRTGHSACARRARAARAETGR